MIDSMGKVRVISSRHWAFVLRKGFRRLDWLLGVKLFCGVTVLCGMNNVFTL